MNKLKAAQIFWILGGVDVFLRSSMYVGLAVYYVQSVGMNPLQLVLVGTVLEVSAFVFELPTGILADTYSRKLSIVLGFLLTGFCFAIEGLVPIFYVILIVEAIRGLGETFISGALEAWIADEVGEDTVGSVLVRNSQITQITGLAGTICGVGLASFYLNLPIITGGLLLMILSGFLLLVISETKFVPTPRNQRSNVQMMSQTFRDGIRIVRGRPVLQSIVGLSFFVGASSEGFDRLWEAHLLTHFSFPVVGELKPVVWFGIISVTTGLVCLTAISLFRKRLSSATTDPHKLIKVLLVFRSIQIAAILFFALNGVFVLAIAALLTKAVVETFSRPLLDTWLIQNIDPKVRATILSLNSQVNAFGQFTLGPVEGAVGAVFTTRAAISFAGLMLSPTILIYGWLLRKKVQSQPFDDYPSNELREQESSI